MRPATRSSSPPRRARRGRDGRVATHAPSPAARGRGCCRLVIERVERRSSPPPPGLVNLAHPPPKNPGGGLGTGGDHAARRITRQAEQIPRSAPTLAQDDVIGGRLPRNDRFVELARNGRRPSQFSPLLPAKRGRELGGGGPPPAAPSSSIRTQRKTRGGPDFGAAPRDVHQPKPLPAIPYSLITPRTSRSASPTTPQSQAGPSSWAS